MMAYDYTDAKVVLLGKEYVGKTALLERFLNARFDPLCRYTATIGSVYGSKQVRVSNGRAMTLGVWDTAGSERYRSMVRLYYRDAKAAVVCYDVMDKSSFQHVRYWIQELRTYEEHARLYICGCKKDLAAPPESKPREVDPSDARNFANDIGARFCETSSKTGEGVNELFELIANELSMDPSVCPPLSSTRPIRVKDESKIGEKKCVCKNS